MSEKKNSLLEKMKASRINRATVVSVTLLLVATLVIVGVTLVSNRSKKNELPPVGTDTYDTTDAPDTQTPDESAAVSEPEETKPPVSDPSKPTSDQLPSFVLPVKGAILKEHDAALQVYSATMGDYRVHLGVDVVTEENAPVYAAADGKVSKIWEDVKMGYCMAIEHSGDCVTVYKNLGKTLPEGIAEGVSVRSGQLVAMVGNSAMVEIAEEPHLHFEMTVGGLSVDPLEYYDEKALEALSLDSSYGE